jgi:hypothetical protein
MSTESANNRIEDDYALVDGKGDVVVQGTNVPGTAGSETTGRRSHTCCGCCCDTRRAVIVVNIVNICLAALSVLLISTFTSEKFLASLDDDQNREAWSSVEKGAVGFNIAIGLLGTACSISAIYGAIKYNRMFVMIGAIWFALEAVRCMIFYDIGFLLISAFFWYPHVVFYREVSVGIMTPGNYPKEEKCCCV